MGSDRRRAAIYTRISRDMTGQGEGVERQLEDCRQLAKERGLDVIAELSDNDISASTGRKRQGYDKLLKLIHEGSISAVVAWNADRLHRRTTELEAYITACQPRDIQTFTVKAGHVDMATAAGRMTARVVGAVAQQVILLVGAQEIEFLCFLLIPVQGVDDAVLIT